MLRQGCTDIFLGSICWQPSISSKTRLMKHMRVRLDYYSNVVRISRVNFHPQQSLGVPEPDVILRKNCTPTVALLRGERKENDGTERRKHVERLKDGVCYLRLSALDCTHQGEFIDVTLCTNLLCVVENHAKRCTGVRCINTIFYCSRAFARTLLFTVHRNICLLIRRQTKNRWQAKKSPLPTLTLFAALQAALRPPQFFVHLRQ